MLRENGLNERWMSDIFNYNRRIIETIDQKSKDLKHKYTVLSFLNVMDTFCLLAIGFSLSFKVFIMEKFCKFIQHESVKKPKQSRRNHIICLNIEGRENYSHGYFLN